MPASVDGVTPERLAGQDRAKRLGHPTVGVRLAPSLAIAAISAVAIGIPLLSAFSTGAMGIPHNDDWAYSRIALDLAEHGELNLVGWNQMNLVGHLVWALPFVALLGASLETLHIAQAVAAALGLLAAYFLVRRFASVGFALVTTAVVAAFPGYPLLSTSYMTDTTAFMAQMGCLLFGVLSLRERRHSGALLALSLALGLFAYTVREAALAAPLAVLAGRFVAYPGSRARRRSVLLLALALVFAVAFFVWRHSLPGDEEPWLVGDASYYTRAEELLRAFFTVAFAVSPALLILLATRRRTAASRWSAAAALATLFLGTLVAVRSGGGPLTLFSGNALTRVGAVDVSLPGRPVLFSRPVWAAMTLLALVAGAVLAGLIVHRLKSSRLGPMRGSLARAAAGSAPKIVVAVYLLLSIAFLGLRAAAGTSGLYDRYLWGIAVALLILLPMRPRVARRGRRLLHAGAFGAVLLLAAVSLVVVVEENTSSAARWEAGKAAVARGTAAIAVDAGFEWMGWHYPRIVGDGTGPRLWRDPATWYNVLKFPSAGNCVLMSFAQRGESWLNLIEVRKYQPFVLWGSRPLFVYRNPRACAAGPS